jgi:uncharacterized membrane protein
VAIKIDEVRFHQLFEVGILIKAVSAATECAAGIVLGLFSTTTLAHAAAVLFQQELLEDPHDVLATHLLSMAQDLTVGTKSFYAFYLISHGVVKLAVVIGLLMGKLWAYPASLVVLAGFVAYQLYRFSHTQTAGLIVLTVFDLIVMGLIWHEYRQVRRHRGASSERPAG